ncbi:MAG: hypothetical protein HY842_01265 [Bacteroidetes bacterium]|nr:hypothetical protein [Bacteroidota bacterium]
MDKQIEKLWKAIKLWLTKNGIETDTSFYTIEKWRSRNEEFHNESEFVITTEGGLNFILNYGEPDEFDELVESFGYYYELGHSWNLGFYKIEESVLVDRKSESYGEKLKDSRWQNKRKNILKRAIDRCEDCGDSNHLEIHHCYYNYGTEPWEYPLDSLRCLCRSCHEKRGDIERIFRAHLASLKTNEIESLITLIDNGCYWYPKEKLFKFINAIGYDQINMRAAFEDVISSRSDE